MTARTIDLLNAADDHASRPAATAVPAGALYSCTDHSLIYRSDGAAWSTWATLAGGTAILQSLADAKGDIIVATGADTFARLAVGSDGDVLTADSGEASGLVWAAPTGGGSSVDDPPGSPDAFDYEFTGNTTSSLPSGFAWVNQGSAFYREGMGAGALGMGGQGYQLHEIRKNVPAGASWQITCKIELIGNLEVMQGGLILADSSGNNRITLAKRGPHSAFMIGKHSGVSSFSGEWSGGDYVSLVTAQVHYVRITKNSSTSYDVHVSADGSTWQAIVTAANFTSHLTTIDKFGFVIDPENSSSDGGFLLVHWMRKTA